MDIFDIALALTPGVGSITAKKLTTAFFSAERVFSQPIEKLMSVANISEKIAHAIFSRAAMQNAQKELEYCKKYNIVPIAYNDFNYPELLRQIPNPPYILYTQGNLDLLSLNTISMIGTRNCSNQAISICDMITQDINKEIYNAVIVSGLALGVDGLAHRAALNNNLPTIAVLPCPLPKIVPSEHKLLAQEIVKKGGLLISEMHSHQTTMRNTYVARNRIIAALSYATIVVQSGNKGGSMITMDMVKRYNRVPFAVPGRIYEVEHIGCNRLIRFGDANMICCAEDIIRHLEWENKRREKSREEYIKTTFTHSLVKESIGKEYPDAPADFDPKRLSPAKLKLLRSMLSEEPLFENDLEKMNPMPIQEFNVILIELELEGLIRPISGHRYERLIPLSALND